MTSTVIVHAHCSDNVRVRIVITEDDYTGMKSVSEYFLSNKEEQVITVHGNIGVYVREEPKP